jgi:hypothetical protein
VTPALAETCSTNSSTCYRLRRCRQQAGEQGQAGIGIGQVDEDRDELVTAETGERVPFAQDLLHAAGDGRQNLVAGGVSVLIVDRLEAIEVEIDHRQRLPAALRLGNRVPQAVAEQRAVGQAGEDIVIGVALELAQMRLGGGDVGEERDAVMDGAVVVAHGTDGQRCEVQLAPFAAAPDLAVPVSDLDNAAVHLGVELRPMTAGSEHRLAGARPPHRWHSR